MRFKRFTRFRDLENDRPLSDMELSIEQAITRRSNCSAEKDIPGAGEGASKNACFKA